MLTPDSVLLLNPNAVVRDEDRVCFNKENGCILQLNDVGYALILHFESPSSVRQAISSISTIFGQRDLSITDDIVNFSEYLLFLGMLTGEAL